MFFFSILFTSIGLLLTALAIPLILRRVKPNALYGLRVPATFADEWVWYEANARSGRDLLIVGVTQIALALLLPLVPGVTETVHALGNVAVLVLGTLTSCVIGWKRANRLLAARR